MSRAVLKEEAKEVTTPGNLKIKAPIATVFIEFIFIFINDEGGAKTGSHPGCNLCFHTALDMFILVVKMTSLALLNYLKKQNLVGTYISKYVGIVFRTVVEWLYYCWNSLF